MTVELTDIEEILGPLRKFDTYDNRMISLVPMVYTDPPERWRAWATIRWTGTHVSPVSDWLGSVEGISSHAEVLRRMRVAAFVAFMDRVPVLAAEHPWCFLDHQTAGHACRHIRFLGRRILLRPEIDCGLLEIASSCYNSQLGRSGPSLSELVLYRSQLQEMGLDCNSSNTFKYLMEGFYPIDLSQTVIDQVCVQPFSLESLLGNPRPYGPIEDYAIFAIIAQNGD